MREIKNNMDIKTVQDVRFAGSDKSESAPEAPNASTKEIKDFANPPAEALGRSQVKSADNVKNDVAFGIEHPEAIESSDRFFESTYSTLKAQGHPNAYEEAAAQATVFGKEFV